MVLGSICGQVPAVGSIVKRMGYRSVRSGVKFPGRSNRHSVANGSPPLRRFCATQAILLELHFFIDAAERQSVNTSFFKYDVSAVTIAAHSFFKSQIKSSQRRTQFITLAVVPKRGNEWRNLTPRLGA